MKFFPKALSNSYAPLGLLIINIYVYQKKKKSSKIKEGLIKNKLPYNLQKFK